MTLPNKTPSTQTYRLMLYQRALHPELFNIQDRAIVAHASYELEAWIMPGGHAMRFQTDKLSVVELVLDHEINLPERGLLYSLPCLGEKEHDQTIEDHVRYVAAVQTEQLSDNLYNATFAELKDFAQQTKALAFESTNEDGSRNLSMLDIQRYKSEIHAQGYHLLGSAGFILRTQSIFEII